MSNEVSKRIGWAFHKDIAAGNAGKLWDGEENHCAGTQVIYE